MTISGTRKKELERLFSGVKKAFAEKGVDLPLVFASGPAPCAIMVIGEAPGRDETRLGMPFVGKAGGFFVKVLEETLGLNREDIYITNVVKLWPTIQTKRLKTRKPTSGEEAEFIPCLKKEIKAVDPKVILAVGKTAYSALFPGEAFSPGKFQAYENIPVMPVYHPAYILRRQKRLEESLKELKDALGKVKALL